VALGKLEKTALLVKTQSRSTNVPAPEQLAPVKCAVVNNVAEAQMPFVVTTMIITIRRSSSMKRDIDSLCDAVC
jgi:hypothetical protein